MTCATDVADLLRDKLAAFGPSVEGSSLFLLRAVDATVESLNSVEKLSDALVVSARDLIKQINDAPVVPERFLDADDSAISKLEAGYRVLEERLPTWLKSKSAIDADPKLSEAQRELLHSAFDTYLDSIATLIEINKDLCAAIISHDLAAEKAPSIFYSSPDELIESLHKIES